MLRGITGVHNILVPCAVVLVDAYRMETDRERARDRKQIVGSLSVREREETKKEQKKKKKKP